MLNCKEEDGRISRTYIRYIQTINLANISEGITIQPDFGFWSKKIGTHTDYLISDMSIHENHSDWDYFNCYWIEKTLHHAVVDLCDEFGIGFHHVDNIVIPVSEIRYTNRDLLPIDLDTISKDANRLLEVFHQFEKPFNELDSITFRIGHVIGLRTDIPYARLGNKKTFRISHPRIVQELASHLARLAKTDRGLHDLLNDQYILNNQDFRYPKYQKQIQIGVVKMLYEYLQQNGIGTTHHDRCGMVGMFLSLSETGYIPTRKIFDKDEKAMSEYPKYKSYCADLVRKRMGRASDDRTKTKRKK